MAERLNAPVLKTGNRVTCSGVQIPLSPPSFKLNNKNVKLEDGYEIRDQFMTTEN